jgi:putative phosphoserine phosphatase/1-acylglycerol-3-phosphate O-acyltransferase
MTSLTEALEVVEAGPKGPHIGAFFDLDGTLVNGYTISAFYRDRIQRREISAGEFSRTMLAALDAGFGGDTAKAADVGFAGLKGRSEEEIAQIAERLFAQRIAPTIRAEARDLVRAHRRMGHTIAVASSATRFQIAPVARDLKIEHILCTELEVADGLFTGRLVGKMLWGKEKGRAVRAFARTHGIDLEASYGYANGAEDVAFLSSVGRPNALNPHPGLRSAAEGLGWPIVTLREPVTPGLRSVARTAAALGGANLGMAAGALLGLVTGDRRRGINTGIELASDAALRLAGVRLNVVGEENLRKARPAIFVANHQSSLDPIVVGALLRRDFTGVAKKEARADPRMLLLTLLLDPAFVDRGNTAQARRELDALIARIRSGTSVLIFPEGTRAPTQTLGRFKKGALHMSMQARVPIIPVVLRNTGELMWRRSRIINAGTVDVAVLEPIDTAEWSADELDDRARDVRRMFEDTLENWPTHG